ncbi:putative short-chain dehydrogenase protein [Eutypa lata UCREL1]|uniref:Putative short-chain dehydrogenase protein n=1 Tax=Eutypa lata (strain UCR-EL1) TaxID=1287681 RepID=M7SXA6_EUTLA|nr:putative short-chain dehydrogenase protein [Eutypa lata UCREL1]
MVSSFSALWEQYFPPKPTFTEKDVKPGSQVDRVFIITGANSGVGLELVKLLYPTGATIYLASRSPPKIQAAIEDITTCVSPAPETPAILKALHLDLADLTTVKPAAALFAAQETRLDILWNNAGSGFPRGSTTKQGIDAHVGTHCVAPLLFTEELLPLLQATAKSTSSSSSSSRGSVRVVWTGSVQIDMNAPEGGVDFARIERPPTTLYQEYAASKAGNYFLAVEGARRWGRDGIVSVCQNPGNVWTNIYANEYWLFATFLRVFVMHEARYGAYTMLFAGFSPDIGEGNNGAYIWPWGRIRPVARPDVLQAASQGKATDFWNWCERAWKQHV